MNLPCVLAVALLAVLSAVKGEEFQSLAQLRSVEPGIDAMYDLKDADDVFNTAGIATRLNTIKRVRWYRKPASREDFMESDLYFASTRKAPLKGLLSKKEQDIVEVSETDFRPILRLASDFSNYGGETLCGFNPGVALLIGDSYEPDFVLICCFKCHDIQVIRRPHRDHPMPYVIKLGMSPELETAIFNLTWKSYPKDSQLWEFKLEERTRALKAHKLESDAK